MHSTLPSSYESWSAQLTASTSWALYLDARHRVTHVHTVSVGHLAGSLVHPREVFKGAILANAAALVVGQQPFPPGMCVHRPRISSSVRGSSKLENSWESSCSTRSWLVQVQSTSPRPPAASNGSDTRRLPRAFGATFLLLHRIDRYRGLLDVAAKMAVEAQPDIAWLVDSLNSKADQWQAGSMTQPRLGSDPVEPFLAAGACCRPVRSPPQRSSTLDEQERSRTPSVQLGGRALPSPSPRIRGVQRPAPCTSRCAFRRPPAATRGRSEVQRCCTGTSSGSTPPRVLFVGFLAGVAAGFCFSCVSPSSQHPPRER